MASKIVVMFVLSVSITIFLHLGFLLFVTTQVQSSGSRLPAVTLVGLPAGWQAGFNGYLLNH